MQLFKLKVSDSYELVIQRISFFFFFKQKQNKFYKFYFQLVCKQMSRGVLAVFGQATKQSIHTLKSFTNTYHLPFIIWSNPVKFDDISETLRENEENNVYENDVTNYQTEFNNESEIGNEEETNSIDDSSSPKDVLQNFQLFLNPDLGQTLISLIKQNRWEKIYYIYNYDEGNSK